MKTNIFLLIFLFYGTSAKAILNNTYKRIPENAIEDVIIRYDPNCLRIPGNNLSIGITTVLKNGDITETRGYLMGNCRWRNFIIKVEGGNFCFGKIRIHNEENYLKSKGILVSVYTRKSKRLIKTQYIPFHYETSVQLITKGNYRKAPGNKIDIGIRKTYNNMMVRDLWMNYTGEVKKDFVVSTSGGFIKNGKLYIHSDPFSINNHTVLLTVNYKKNMSLKDSLSVLLDYRDNYKYWSYGTSGFNGSSGSSGSSGNTGATGGNGGFGGHGYNGERASDLEVYADVYFDTLINEELMFVEVEELSSGRLNRYFVNTNGGSIEIQSSGGSGGDGGNGGNGGNGGRGYDGSTYTETVWINDSTSKEITHRLPGGNGGNGGNGGDGGFGADGGNGGDIYVYYTPFAKNHLHLIRVISSGGSGGFGGSGGSSGSGGSGGFGDPNGSSGSSGCSGNRGRRGRSGYSGQVKFIETRE